MGEHCFRKWLLLFMFLFLFFFLFFSSYTHFNPTTNQKDQFDDAHRNDVEFRRSDFEIASIPFHNYIYAFPFITIYGNARLSNCQQKRRGNNHKYELLKNSNNNNNGQRETVYHHPFRDPETSLQMLLKAGF